MSKAASTIFKTCFLKFVFLMNCRLMNISNFFDRSWLDADVLLNEERVSKTFICVL